MQNKVNMICASIQIAFWNSLYNYCTYFFLISSADIIEMSDSEFLLRYLQGAGVEVPCGAKFPPSLVFGEIDAQGWQVMFLHNWVFKKTKQKQKKPPKHV